MNYKFLDAFLISNYKNYSLARLIFCTLLSLTAILLFHFLVKISYFNRDINLYQEINNPQNNQDLYINFEDAIKEITVTKGDTLNNILATNNFTKNDIAKIIEALKLANIKLILQIGQKISLEYDATENSTEKYDYKKVTIFIDAKKRIELSKVQANYIAKEVLTPFSKFVVTKTSIINNTLAQTLQELGLQKKIIQTILQNYHHQIDLKKQIKPGDKITLMLENDITSDNKIINDGGILYSCLTSNERDYQIYRYAPNGKAHHYYSQDGKNIKKAFLKNPLHRVKISSQFGKIRTHDRGFSYKHKGVDFSGPIGTNILSSGDGIVTHMGWKSGYGKSIKIMHNNNIATFYAHLGSFSSKLKLGGVVHQGQFLGTIGMTGRTTGPHLHYEVLVNGIQVDPMKVHALYSNSLEHKQLVEFNKLKKSIVTMSKKFEQGETKIKID